jgi:hypothetical protein
MIHDIFWLKACFVEQAHEFDSILVGHLSIHALLLTCLRSKKVLEIVLDFLTINFLVL